MSSNHRPHSTRYGAAYWGMRREEPPHASSAHRPGSTSRYYSRHPGTGSAPALRSHWPSSRTSSRRPTNHSAPHIMQSSRPPASHHGSSSRRSRHSSQSPRDSEHNSWYSFTPSSKVAQVSRPGPRRFELPYPPAPQRRSRTSSVGRTSEQPRSSSSHAHRRGHSARERNDVREAVRSSDRNERGDRGWIILATLMGLGACALRKKARD